MKSEGDGSIPVLHQLRISHYNEKARWALDYKGITHRRRTLAPGLHPIATRRLAGTQTTPILELDGEVLTDSTEIIAALEARSPEPALYPAGEPERERALALEEHFDTELGPYIRGAVFAAVLPDARASAAAFSQGLGPGKRAIHRATLRLARPAIRRAVIDSYGGPDTCREKTLAALDRLEAELGDRKYLVGDSFSSADLTAAALFHILVAPPQFPYEYPDPWPEQWESLRRSLAERPGYRWVEEMYRRHRGTSAEVPE